MTIDNNNDNIYQVGSTIFAKENPALKLTIRKYYQRIYYCVDASNPTHKERVYFERELIAPAT